MIDCRESLLPIWRHEALPPFTNAIDDVETGGDIEPG